MTEEKAREVILAEWLALHPDLRSGGKQLDDFAKAAGERLRFPIRGDRIETIKGWLLAAKEPR